MKNLKNFVFATIVVAVVLASCNSKNGAEERNKATLIKVNEEILANKNLAFADQAFTSDYTFSGIPDKGPELIKGFANEIGKAFPDLQYKLDLVMARDNMVAWRRTHTATHSGNFYGYNPTGMPLTWHELNITRFTDDGKIAEEWGTSDFDVNVQRATNVEGVYVNYGELTGQAIYRNGYFTYVGGPVKGPLISFGGTYVVKDGVITNTFTYSTDPKQVGSTISLKFKSWSGDTLTYATVDAKGAELSVARSLRVSR